MTDSFTCRMCVIILVIACGLGGILACDKIAVSGEGQVITSPNFPKSYYADTYMCWEISTSSATISVSIHSLRLEGGQDYLYIYDGNGDDAPVLAALTGDMDDGSVVRSTGSNMLIVFVSDLTVEAQGFEICVHTGTDIDCDFNGDESSLAEAAGIGIGVVLAIAVLTFVMIRFAGLRRYRQKRQTRTPVPASGSVAQTVPQNTTPVHSLSGVNPDTGPDINSPPTYTAHPVVTSDAGIRVSPDDISLPGEPADCPPSYDMLFGTNASTTHYSGMS